MKNTKLYKDMVQLLTDKECSVRELAKESGISYLTLLFFYNFNGNEPIRTLNRSTKSKLHNRYGIPFEDMDEYNNVILKEREG